MSCGKNKVRTLDFILDLMGLYQSSTGWEEVD